MVDTPLNRRMRTYLDAAAQRHRRRHRWPNLLTSTVTIAALALAFWPDGRPDALRLSAALAVSGGFWLLLGPLRRRAGERYHQRERVHFLQIVPASSPAYPQALGYLLECGLHRKLARELAAHLPGGPELLAETDGGLVWLEDLADAGAPAPPATDMPPAPKKPAAKPKAKAKPKPEAAPAAQPPLDYIPLDPIHD